MRKLGKIITYLFVTVILLLIILTIVAKLAENKITDFVTEKVSEYIDAPIEISEATFTLIRRFPLSTIDFKGITLGSQVEPGDSGFVIAENDTLASIENLYISVRSKELLKKKIEIVKIEIKGATINYIVDTTGHSNFDFLIDTTSTNKVDTTEAAPLNLSLNQLLLKNIQCNYRDKKLKANARLHIPEIEISGKIKNETYEGDVEGNVLLSNCSFPGTPMDLMEQTEIILDIGYVHDSILIKEIEIFTEGAQLNLAGNAVLKEKIPANIHVTGEKFDLTILKKYIPENILKEYKIDHISGILSLNATINGELIDSIMPKINAEFDFEKGTAQYDKYPLLQNIHFKGTATNGFLKNNKTTQALIKEFHFETGDNEVDMTLSAQNLDNLKYKVNSKLKLNVSDFMDFVPDSVLRDAKGNVSIEFDTQGELPDSIDSSFADYLLKTSETNIQLSDMFINLNDTMIIDSLNGTFRYFSNTFSVRNFAFLVDQYNYKINNASLDLIYSGSVTNTNSLGFKLKSLNIRTPQSTFRATGTIRNLAYPTFQINTHFVMGLEEFKPFLPDTLINDVKGELTLNINSGGTIHPDSIADKITDFAFNKSSLLLDMNNISVDMPDTLMNVKNLSGSIELKYGTLRINKLKGNYMNIPWGIDSTKVTNIYQAYFLKSKDTIKLDTRLSFGDLSYTAFAPLLVSDTTQSTSMKDENSESKDNPLPNFEIKGKLRIKSITYEKAKLNNISALYNLTNSEYIVDQLKFEGFEGKMNSSLKYTKNENGENTVNTKSNIEHMNIRDLLYDFNNFDQTDITHENITGLITSEIHTEIKMIGDSIVPDDIRLKGSFIIADGGIYDYAPLRDLPKITSLDNLNKIEFKTFDTKVFIFKSRIFIPETYISSTAFDIAAFGMQKFNDDFEYHLQFHLKDLLMGKSKKLLKEQSKLGDDAGRDKRNTRDVFSEMVDGKMKNGFDNDVSRQNMKTKINTQETILKLKFHEKIVTYDTEVK